MALERRRRIHGNIFGDLEKVIPGETHEEKIAKMEMENARLVLDLVNKELDILELEDKNDGLTTKVESLEFENAGLLLDSMHKAIEINAQREKITVLSGDQANLILELTSKGVL